MNSPEALTVLTSPACKVLAKKSAPTAEYNSACRVIVNRILIPCTIVDDTSSETPIRAATGVPSGSGAVAGRTSILEGGSALCIRAQLGSGRYYRDTAFSEAAKKCARKRALAS